MLNVPSTERSVASLAGNSEGSTGNVAGLSDGHRNVRLSKRVVASLLDEVVIWPTGSVAFPLPGLRVIVSTGSVGGFPIEAKPTSLEGR